MSDFHDVTSKLKEGKEWRGTIRVSIDDEEHDLTVRQLVDPEFEEVMKLIDRDELQELKEAMPEDVREELRELQEQEEELSDEEAERMVELREELEDEAPDLFDVLSTDTFEGIRRCAKYGVEPDDEDLREVFVDRAAEIEAEYGIKVQQPEDVYEPVKDDYKELIDHATNLTSFTIGLQVLVKTLGDEGN